MKSFSGETQIRWACRELIKGREISHAHEIKEARGWRLAAIIHNLKNRYKWPIYKRSGANGVAYYRLGGNVDADTLEKPRSFHKKKEDARTSSIKKT
ncbi:MAG: hypothetical protein COA45_12440 [Zetaproteobacteria bacterium]|nr:MAG: hypothetical protein COA45_12440 [Zetaproteobacteria bacterium]